MTICSLDFGDYEPYVSLRMLLSVILANVALPAHSLTFTEYETLLDTDSNSIIEIAEHLIYWRKARLIDAVSLKCIYVPFRPTAPGEIKLYVLCQWL